MRPKYVLWRSTFPRAALGLMLTAIAACSADSSTSQQDARTDTGRGDTGVPMETGVADTGVEFDAQVADVPEADSGLPVDVVTDTGPAACAPPGSACGVTLTCSASGRCTCGNGIVDADEDCDRGAGANTAGSGCEPTCRFSCRTATDCPAASPCREPTACDTEMHRCVPGDTLAAGASCGAGMVCDAMGMCRACSMGASCTPTAACRVGSIDCRSGASVCAITGNSPMGTACMRAGGSGRCNATGVCVECVADADCGAGRICGGGTCTVGCSATSPCPGGQSCCGSVCINTQTNTNHCGMCGRSCMAPVGGTPTCAAGVCGSTCPAGQTNCGGTCRPTGAACTSAGTGGCQATGTIMCSGTTTACSATPRTSGACTTPINGQCGAGGTCACPSGTTNCGGTCVNTQTSISNCGACGRVCTAPGGGTATCTAGVCGSTCPAGQTNCGGVCRPTGAACTSAGTGGCQNTGTIVCSGTTTACSATPRTSGACTSPAGGTCNAMGTCVAPTPRTFVCAYATSGNNCDNFRFSNMITSSDLATAINTCRAMLMAGSDYCGVVVGDGVNPPALPADAPACTAAMGSWCTTRNYCRFRGRTGSVCGASGTGVCACP
ncbi:MAG: hypothetical protein JNK05_31140 [Myxococcales bacterium]|nr:hypothetical protein [Myxococcales bacterium]